MIRPLILFLFMVANAAYVSYVDNFAYLPVLRAQQGGGEFDVRVGANVAQTIRKNFEWNPIFESVAQRSVALAARLSGCTVSWVIATLRCRCLGCPAMVHRLPKNQNCGVSFRFHVIVMNIVMVRTN